MPITSQRTAFNWMTVKNRRPDLVGPRDTGSFSPVSRAKMKSVYARTENLCLNRRRERCQGIAKTPVAPGT